jgi:PAS domain S-box-containing protein
MEQSADGIYLVDVDTKSIIEANRTFARMLGYTQEETQGMHNYQLVAATPENIDRKFQEIVASPSPLSFERTFRKKDGSLLDVWITVSVLSYRGKRVACGIIRDIAERKRAEKEREQLINELQEALANIKTLSGLIPICAQCKKIRDDKGYWQQVEVYVREHSEAKFSHGLCPECTKLLFPELQEKRKGGNPI